MGLTSLDVATEFFRKSGVSLNPIKSSPWGIGRAISAQEGDQSTNRILLSVSRGTGGSESFLPTGPIEPLA